MSGTHRIYINRAHVFDDGVTWTTVAGLYPHAYVPEEEYASAIARAERAEAAARDAHLALIEAERFRTNAMTHLRDNGEFVGRDELLGWGDGLGVRCRFAIAKIAALKGGAA